MVQQSISSPVHLRSISVALNHRKPFPEDTLPLKKMENVQFHSISFPRSTWNGCIATGFPFHYVVGGNQSFKCPLPASVPGTDPPGVIEVPKGENKA